MTVAKSSRNDQVRTRRTEHASLSTIAREFGVTKHRIAEILEHTGGDPLRPLRTADLATATVFDLGRERPRLAGRVRSDLGRLLAIDEELEARRVDRILGFDD